MIDKLQTVTLDSGRIVTGQTAWWYAQIPTTQFHFQLFCIHNIKLTQGCNDCLDKEA